MDPQITAALIGLVGLAGGGIPGYFTFRSNKRLRAERAGIEQQKVNQDQFDRFTAALEKRMAEADHERANLLVQADTTNRLLRISIHHIDEWRMWARAHVRPTIPAPVLPPELASLPLVWTGDSHVNGGGS